MTSAEAEKGLGAQDEVVEVLARLSEVPSGHTQSSESPVMGNQGLVSAHEACRTQGEDKCPIGPVSKPELLEEQLKLEEQKLKPEVEALEERGLRPMASIVRSSHGPKRKPVKKGPAPTALVPVHQLLQP
uniref:Uncharacterized protein n=1 Tax=Molossus molossus TaxID=27622 RepID=A0A7J8C5V0_MOLMO|nr:hypothetical protein HJG59_001718 [Molossus molossus]